MSKVQVLNWEDTIEISVLAIFSHLPDFGLAYHLNKEYNSSFNNVTVDYSTKHKNGMFSFSLFRSSNQQNTLPLFLVENKSIEHNEGLVNQNTLFQAGTIQVPLIPSLKKWPFLLFSEDSDEVSVFLKKPFTKNISFIQPIDFKLLKNTEQSILTDIIYDEQH